jgi:hypothetical protein
VLQGIHVVSFSAEIDVWKTTAHPNDLLAAWVDGPPPSIDALLQDNWKEQVLTGAHDVLLEAGTAIGQLTDLALGLHFTLVDPSGERVHPALALPGFADANANLAGHPLVTALGALDIDVQIHLRLVHLKDDQSKSSGTKGTMSPLTGATVTAINARPGNVMDSGVTDVDGRVTSSAAKPSLFMDGDRRTPVSSSPRSRRWPADHRVGWRTERPGRAGRCGAASGQ